MDQRGGATLAVLAASRTAIKESSGHAARVDQRLFEVRHLLEWNEVVFRASQNQNVLPDAIGNRSELVMGESFQGIVGACCSHGPKRVAVGPGHARVFHSQGILLHRPKD